MRLNEHCYYWAQYPPALAGGFYGGHGMIILPAIDLLGGRCVRLKQGEYDQVTDYGNDPVAIARKFMDAGAKWLHVVNLDGARLGALDQSRWTAHENRGGRRYSHNRGSGPRVKYRG
jgi:hypothetical protein